MKRIIRRRTINICLYCKKDFHPSYDSSGKYCSNKCQMDMQYRLWITDWLTGHKVYESEQISSYIRRYLIETRGEQCEICKWNIRHSVTKKVPLQIDHIDGNYKNNKIDNLKLLCPNCHSLTLTYGNLNKGHGRVKRKERRISQVK